MAAKKSLTKKRKREDDISDEFESDVGAEDAELSEESASEDENETRAQKRLRLAKAYLEDLKQSHSARNDVDAGEIDREIIEARLQKDALQESENFHNLIADSLVLKSIHTTPRSKHAHRLSVTCATCPSSLSDLYTSSKDGSIVRWSLSQLPTNSRNELSGHITFVAKVRSSPKKDLKAQPQKGSITGHKGEILTLSASDDGRRLISGGKDHVVGLWDVEGDKLEWKTGNAAHRDAVTAIAVRPTPGQVYTASLDRSVKLFSLESLALIDTLFGHQDNILDLSVLRGENAVTVGARDRTARYYKVVEETALVFRGGGEGKKVEGQERFLEGSLECCSMVDKQHFLTGGDSGMISLWHITRKKPIYSFSLAHGIEEKVSEEGFLVKNPRWITSISCLKYGDVFASGSWDGYVRLWRIDASLKSFSPLFQFPAAGIVVSLQVLTAPIIGRKKSIDEKEDVVVVAGIGQEPRLGRWLRRPEGKNGAIIAVLAQKSPTV